MHGGTISTPERPKGARQGAGSPGTGQAVVAERCVTIDGSLSGIAPDALVATAWLARELVPCRVGNIAAGCGFYHDRARAALKIAVRHRLIREIAPAYQGQSTYWEALVRAAPLADAITDAREPDHVIGAQVRAGRLLKWLKANHGLHGEQRIAGFFLFTRFDLIDALELLEEAGLAQSEIGEFGKRRWGATDFGGRVVSAAMTAGETAHSHERATS